MDKGLKFDKLIQYCYMGHSIYTYTFWMWPGIKKKLAMPGIYL